MMKIVCPILVYGEEQTKVLTTSSSMDVAAVAAFVKNKPGVGKPFLAFATLPAQPLAAADFEGAPIVSALTSENQTAINDMLANPPLDRLTWA